MKSFNENRNDILFWLNENELKKISSSEYWNDEEIEEEKEWFITDGDTQKLVNYLKYRTTYLEEYESIVKFARNANLEIKGTGLDLAAGVCWTTAFMSRIEGVKKIYAVDISRHRILKIAPKIFNLFKADTKKIIRVIRLAQTTKLFCQIWKPCRS